MTREQFLEETTKKGYNWITHTGSDEPGKWKTHLYIYWKDLAFVLSGDYLFMYLKSEHLKPNARLIEYWFISDNDINKIRKSIKLILQG